MAEWLTGCGGGGRKGGIFEGFLSRGSTRFSTKFDAKYGIFYNRKGESLGLFWIIKRRGKDNKGFLVGKRGNLLGLPVDNFSVGWTEKGWFDKSGEVWYMDRVF